MALLPRSDHRFFLGALGSFAVEELFESLREARCCVTGSGTLAKVDSAKSVGSVAVLTLNRPSDAAAGGLKAGLRELMVSSSVNRGFDTLLPLTAVGLGALIAMPMAREGLLTASVMGAKSGIASVGGEEGAAAGVEGADETGTMVAGLPEAGVDAPMFEVAGEVEAMPG